MRRQLTPSAASSSPVRARSVGVLGILLFVASLGGAMAWWSRPPPSRRLALVPELTVLRDIEYSPGGYLDVMRPAAGDALDAVVLVHGCCGGREDMFQLAHELAARGVLVFNVGWRTTTEGGDYPLVYEQVACAVRFARGSAHEFGGNGRVTLVGWSDGALLGATVALSPDDEWQGECPSNGSPRPDRFVGISGFYGWARPPDLTEAGGATFFARAADDAAAWASGTPYGRIGHRGAPPFTLVSGALDVLVDHARCLDTALRGAGHVSSLVVVPDAAHLDVLSPRNPAGAAVVDAILEPPAPAPAEPGGGAPACP